MKAFRLGFVALVFFAGCVLDSNNTVAGGEDFPNTITPLGKVAADDISSHSNWDQFQSIDTTPNLSADSLTASVSTAARRALTMAGAVKDTILTLKQSGPYGISIVQHIQVNSGDGNLATRADNRVKEFDVLRSRSGDTVEWTQLTDADGDSVLWGKGDSGVVLLKRQFDSPLTRPQVLRVWSSLKARIYHFGKTSTVLSYTERCVWKNGDTTVFTTKGIHSDSLLAASDTSLVTYDRSSRDSGSPSTSKGRYWVKLGKLTRPFGDNALLHFELVNRWKSGVIRYDSVAFTPDAPVLSGQLNIRGSFRTEAWDSTGANSHVAGVFRNDSIQTNMKETRNGMSKSYHLVYDGDGNVQKKDRLADNDSDDVVAPKQFRRK